MHIRSTAVSDKVGKTLWCFWPLNPAKQHTKSILESSWSILVRCHWFKQYQNQIETKRNLNPGKFLRHPGEMLGTNNTKSKLKHNTTSILESSWGILVRCGWHKQQMKTWNKTQPESWRIPEASLWDVAGTPIVFWHSVAHQATDVIPTLWHTRSQMWVSNWLANLCPTLHSTSAGQDPHGWPSHDDGWGATPTLQPTTTKHSKQPNSQQTVHQQQKRKQQTANWITNLNQTHKIKQAKQLTTAIQPAANPNKQPATCS